MDVETLKSYFKTHDKPTQNQFAELIDSVHPETVTHLQAIGIERNTDGVLLVTNIPSEDPLLVGALWNDEGTLKISSGDQA